MRNTVTTGISLAAGLLLLAGCGGGQTGQAAQDTTDTGTSAPTSTSSGAGVGLPERTAPAKSLDLSEPCAIISQQQATNLGVNQPLESANSNEKKGCRYQKGNPGTEGGWYIFVAADTKQTAQDFSSRSPDGRVTKISGYHAYQVDDGGACMIAVDVSDEGSIFINGITRLQKNRAAACPISTKFAEAAIENLPEA
ncbi:Protein of unknown function [Actinopolyspora lacussalsi subsp. righensis]|uniref:DUF3558 domain-containing protein n=1 Tax=Actinopolyspora righensis TaxID=995060 RepID=A0A1I6X2V6_9ACTN|nr:DUF3558 family protein [Actinopolyspora righensis]SFT32610.1 Protein of unknown function [Actinopolyspora righensis]